MVRCITSSKLTENLFTSPNNHEKIVIRLIAANVFYLLLCVFYLWFNLFVHCEEEPRRTFSKLNTDWLMIRLPLNSPPFHTSLQFALWSNGHCTTWWKHFLALANFSLSLPFTAVVALSDLILVNLSNMIDASKPQLEEGGSVNAQNLL